MSLGGIFGLGILPVEGRAIVPLAGMMIGNSMTATVVAGRRVVGKLSDKRAEVEARLVRLVRLARAPAQPLTGLPLCRLICSSPTTGPAGTGPERYRGIRL